MADPFESDARTPAARSPDDTGQTLLDTFFEGVPEMRAYLDRNLHDPERRRERLGRIAQDLVKPRTSRALVVWLARRLCEALGAQVCSVCLRTDEWRRWYCAGQGIGQESWPSQQLLEDLLARNGGPLASGDGVVLPLQGLRGVVGAVWLRGTPPLDDTSQTLLDAIAGTAGMMIEQALEVAAMARDPRTGLLPADAFVRQAIAELRSGPGAGERMAIMALRLHRPTPAAVAELVGAATEMMPGAPLGERAATGARETCDVYAVPPPMATAQIDSNVRELLDDLGEAAASYAADWTGAYVVLTEAHGDVGSVIEQLGAALDVTERRCIVAV